MWVKGNPQVGSFTPFFSFTSLSLSTFPFPRIHIDAGGEGDSDGSWMALWDLGIKKELGKRLSLLFLTIQMGPYSYCTN